MLRPIAYELVCVGGPGWPSLPELSGGWVVEAQSGCPFRKREKITTNRHCEFGKANLITKCLLYDIDVMRSLTLG